MPKFYVQSGSVEVIVAAQDSEAAALWAIHQQSQLPEACFSGEDDDAEMLDDSWDNLLPQWAQGNEFTRSIKVSERGMGRSEAGRFATEAAMAKYGQLLVAVEKLLDRMDNGQTTSGDA